MAKVGVTAQQFQKYETSQNALNVYWLLQFAEEFSVPVQESIL